MMKTKRVLRYRDKVQHVIEWDDGTGLRCLSHREDGPAIEWCSGAKQWYRNGMLHRTDGPAFINPLGSETWFPNGKYINETETWYVNGKYVDIKPILERLDISHDWESWTDEEKFLVRLALP